MRAPLLSSTLVALGLAACTPSKPSPADTTPSATPTPGSTALVVSFYSPGNGVNVAAAQKLDRIVDATKPRPARTSVGWGGEGEHDECFALGELAAEQKREFIARVVKEVGSEDRVHILQNAPAHAPLVPAIPPLR
jgi:hypothetical protein